MRLRVSLRAAHTVTASVNNAIQWFPKNTEIRVTENISWYKLKSIGNSMGCDVYPQQEDE